MSGDGGGSSRRSGNNAEQETASLLYRAIQPGMGNQLGMIAQQLAAGGYGDASTIQGQLEGTYQPMQRPYVEGPEGQALYSGSALMAALRKDLDDRGIKAPK